MTQPRRMIIGISGATGVIYGVRLLQVLKQQGIETHLVVTKAGEMTRAYETDLSMHQLRDLADVWYPIADVGAAISSGSFKTMGMIIAPCSIKSLSAIANSYDADLLTRAADVQLKEGRPVLLLLRETPLHIGHLRLMVQAAENGAVIMPPAPAFYGRPKTVDDIINSTVGRALARIGIQNTLYFEWLGMSKERPPADE